MKEKIIFTNSLIDLAQPRLGTKVIFKTDDFFASANRIISPSMPIFKEGVFDKNGKWMDGWESRRKRVSGHDYIIIKLGKPGKISKVDVDTSHFNGNQHIKFNIFPDGGVARLRLFGSIVKNDKIKNKTINLASLLDGASVVACNNEHFGKAENILAPGKAKNMGDGWETRRRRSKGFDWLILNCIDGIELKNIEISTHHFKGNFPSYCSLQAAYFPTLKNSKLIVKSSIKWKYLLKNLKLSANKTHIFKNLTMKKNKINHIKINIFPDGGISRFRVYGKAT